MKEIKTAAILGLGALGVLFGCPMAEHSAVTVIADRNRIARYTAEQGTVNGKPYSFRYTAPEEGTPVDLILIATKTTALEEVIPMLKSFVGPDTVILSILNGITSEERLEEVYPGHCLWSVAIHMDATREGRNLSYTKMGMIQFGERSGEITPRVRAVEEYFTRCGIPHQVCEDMVYRQWMKLMINVGLNQITAAFDLTYGLLQNSLEAQAMMKQAMEEVIRLSALEGVPLPQDAHEEWTRDILPIFAAPYMPSMAQDMRARRRTEVESFAGEIIRRSRKHGLSAPVNESLYARIREREAEF